MPPINATDPTQAVEAALAQLEETNEDVTSNENETTEEVAPEPKKAPAKAKEPEEEIEDKPIDARTAKALKLLELLEDSDTAPAIVGDMAKKLGILKSDTKQEVKEVERSIKAKVLEMLGDDFPMVSEKLGEVLENVMGEFEKKFETRLEQEKMEARTAQFEKEVSLFITANEIPDEVVTEMGKLSNEFKPTENTSVERYLTKLYKLAQEEVEQKQLTKKKIERINDNASKKAKTELKPQGSESTAKAPPKIRTAKEAVEAAARGETWE